MSAPTSRVVLITSDSRRHAWLARQLPRLVGLVTESKPAAASSAATADAGVGRYFDARDAAEARWFSEGGFPARYPRHKVQWGGSNSAEVYHFVDALAPDVLILFGSSIIKDPLLQRYRGRIVNMHLGLSPYYRGSATNFWPLVDNLPECVGVTIHHATPAVDGGAIIAQARPTPEAADTSHDLGCKAIIAGGRALAKLMNSAGPLPSGVPQRPGGRLCRRNDFTPEALRQLEANFAKGMLASYIAQKRERDARYPIHSGELEHS